MKKWLLLFWVSILCFSGCSKDDKTKNDTDSNHNDEIKESEMFTERDLDASYDVKNAISINLDKKTSSSDAVIIYNNTITIKEEATYILTGTLSDGMIIVDSNNKAKIQIVFDDVNITSSTSAPLYIKEADKVFITLAENSNNTLSSGISFTFIDENKIDGTIFSKQDMTINGNGKLTISSPAGHGIVCKDDLVITSGTYTINASSHGLDANDSIRLCNASFMITSGKDGMHAENSDDESLGFIYIKDGNYDIESEGDGISSFAYTTIEDGTFSILSGGGSVNGEKQTSDRWGGYNERMPDGGRGPQRPGIPNENNTEDITQEEDSSTSIKGIKSSGNMNIISGEFTIDSADDAIHSNSSIEISDGTYVISTGDDGYHADETLIINAGNIQIHESYEGLEALNIEINGGEISLYASDDGLNAAGGVDESGYEGERKPDQFSSNSNGSIIINGGKLYINASGDGIDANGTFTMNDGNVIVCGPTRGDTATLDYDNSAEIHGGSFIGTGASGMAQTFSNTSNQGVYAIQVGNASAKTPFTISDTYGKEIITFSPDLDYSVIIVSTPEIQKGNSYTITIGESSGTFEAY